MPVTVELDPRPGVENIADLVAASHPFTRMMGEQHTDRTRFLWQHHHLGRYRKPVAVVVIAAIGDQ